MTDGMGRRFAEAIAQKDAPGLLALLDPDLEFRGLTPGRAWEADSAEDFVDTIVFGKWFEETDHIDGVEDVQTGSVVDRHRFSYQLQITNPDGTFIVEQQAYFDEENDRITWLRILCSGYRQIDA